MSFSRSVVKATLQLDSWPICLDEHGDYVDIPISWIQATRNDRVMYFYDDECGREDIDDYVAHWPGCVWLVSKVTHPWDDKDECYQAYPVILIKLAEERRANEVP